MGCVSSKQPPVCRNCRKPCSPINHRSRSMHDHNPPPRQGDPYHIVKLTSSTLGSLKLDPFNQSNRSKESSSGNSSGRKDQNKDFLFELIEAKTWSRMIDQKIPKIPPRTPVRTPPGEPEEIDAWELMEGLEDGSPLQAGHNKSFSFHVRADYNPDKIHKMDRSRSKTESISNVNGDNNWKQSNGTPNHTQPDTIQPEPNPNPDLQSNLQSIVSDFDVGSIKTFRRTVVELSSEKPFHLESSDEKNMVIVKDSLPHVKLSRKKDKLIVYFTSLRGIRKTYEDCCNVLVMLKGMGIKVDERDVSMHSGFKDELKELLKDGFSGLPKVFIGKQYIGGIDEIRQLNEDGKLGTAFAGCEKVNDSNGLVTVAICEGCGDVRFVPCEDCSGSCKIHYESEDEDEDEDEDREKREKEERFGFERCGSCNENGLIRCPLCCD